MRHTKSYQYEAHNYERGLSTQTLQATAPAVFSTHKAPERSESFGHVGTWELFAPLREIGYVPVQVMQSGARNTANIVYARSLVRFRAVQDLGSKAPEVFEIVVVNADNGTTAFKFLPGFLRSICTNGCVFGTFMHALNIQHRRNWLDDAVDQVTRLSRDSVHVMEVIEDYKRIEIAPEQQLQLAEYVHVERFGARAELVPFRAEQLLSPVHRKQEDMHVLYSVSQDIQWHVMHGGIEAATEGHRTSVTRPIHAVRDYVRLNTVIADATEIVRRKTLGIPLDRIVEGSIVQ